MWRLPLARTVRALLVIALLAGLCVAMVGKLRENSDKSTSATVSARLNTISTEIANHTNIAAVTSSDYHVHLIVTNVPMLHIEAVAGINVSFVDASGQRLAAPQLHARGAVVSTALQRLAREAVRLESRQLATVSSSTGQIRVLAVPESTFGGVYVLLAQSPLPSTGIPLSLLMLSESVFALILIGCVWLLQRKEPLTLPVLGVQA